MKVIKLILSLIFQTTNGFFEKFSSENLTVENYLKDINLDINDLDTQTRKMVSDMLPRVANMIHTFPIRNIELYHKNMKETIVLQSATLPDQFYVVTKRKDISKKLAWNLYIFWSCCSSCFC